MNACVRHSNLCGFRIMSFQSINPLVISIIFIILSRRPSADEQLIVNIFTEWSTRVLHSKNAAHRHICQTIAWQYSAVTSLARHRCPSEYLWRHFNTSSQLRHWCRNDDVWIHTCCHDFQRMARMCVSSTGRHNSQLNNQLWRHHEKSSSRLCRLARLTLWPAHARQRIDYEVIDDTDWHTSGS